MVTAKRSRTEDCVVGGCRYASKNRQVGSLLGLYDTNGKLDHVGFTSTITDAERAATTRKLEKCGGRRDSPARRAASGSCIRRELVVEVSVRSHQRRPISARNQ